MKCNIARDLLPLYFDGLCSDETRKQLEEHIENCESCKLLKQNLEEEPAVTYENQEWKQSIVPLKKVKKKIRRKNMLIAVCVFFLFLFIGITALLTYGQITKKGYSFELLYEAIRFQHIGRQFACGNIEPLYNVLDNGYFLEDAESVVLRQAYADSAIYDEEMKKSILEKYYQYFDGKDLTYRGIEEISYCENAITGWNRNLFISLKFEGKDQMVYYIVLYKTLSGQYLVDDYFGNPYLSYTSVGETEEPENSHEESYHTKDTLFSCLPNGLKDIDLYMMRQVVLASGQRALQGDTLLAENGQMRLNIFTQKDLTEGTGCLREELNVKLFELAEAGYYVTDITWSAREYDKTRHLYRYQINMELTDAVSLRNVIVAIDCYRLSNKFVYITGTDKIYGNDLPTEIMAALDALYE